MHNLIRTLSGRMLIYLKIDTSEQRIENITQFIMFGIVGVSNTIIGYFLNVLVLFLLRPYKVSFDYIIGNIVGFVLSVLWSFYWNNRLVFVQKEGQHRNLLKSLLKAYAAYSFTGIILNNIFSWLLITVFQISKYIAPLINLIISVPLNFVINKLWTFKSGKE